MRKSLRSEVRRGNEVLGILLIALAVLTAIGLFTYSPIDWPNSSAPAGETSNLGGRAGALISYSLLFFMGYAAYPVPVLLLLWGLNRARDSRLRKLSILTVTFLVLATLFCTFTSLLGFGSPEIRFKLGGALGLFLSQASLKYFGAIGSYVLIVTVFIITITLTTEIRLSELLPSLGRRLFRLADKVRAVPTVGGQRRTEPKEAKTIVEGEPEPAIGWPAGTAETEVAEGAEYQYPSLDLLDDPPEPDEAQTREQLLKNAAALEAKLADFDVHGKVVQISPGPVITRYELEPAPGVKINRIVNLADDLALVMKGKSIRIVAPIPGKAVIGIEIPNPKPSVVYLKEILQSEGFQRSGSKLTLALGKTISGEPYCTQLSQMPHLLIAGATGSGKSVCINGIICSILLNRVHPQEVQFIMVDPKMLELPIYNGIPHLYGEVVTDAKQVANILKKVVQEMERRYKILASFGARNIEDFNRKVKTGEIGESGDGEEPLSPLPYLMVIVDELADLMLSSEANDIEASITRLAQMARAVGIHLVLATQRPSVDVITGVIKANFPTRAAFQVASKIDSRTILDVNGAERLLGKGDMLFLSSTSPHPQRIHGSYISTGETERIVNFIKEQAIYFEEIELPEPEDKESEGPSASGQDEYFEKAKELVIRHQQGSISLLQRRLGIGYARAARLIDQLEQAGIVGKFTGTKTREVLVKEESLKEDNA